MRRRRRRAAGGTSRFSEAQRQLFDGVRQAFVDAGLGFPGGEGEAAWPEPLRWAVSKKRPPKPKKDATQPSPVRRKPLLRLGDVRPMQEWVSMLHAAEGSPIQRLAGGGIHTAIVCACEGLEARSKVANPFVQGSHGDPIHLCIREWLEWFVRVGTHPSEPTHALVEQLHQRLAYADNLLSASASTGNAFFALLLQRLYHIQCASVWTTSLRDSSHAVVRSVAQACTSSLHLLLACMRASCGASVSLEPVWSKGAHDGDTWSHTHTGHWLRQVVAWQPARAMLSAEGAQSIPLAQAEAWANPFVHPLTGAVVPPSSPAHSDAHAWSSGADVLSDFSGRAQALEAFVRLHAVLVQLLGVQWLLHHALDNASAALLLLTQGVYADCIRQCEDLLFEARACVSRLTLSMDEVAEHRLQSDMKPEDWDRNYASSTRSTAHRLSQQLLDSLSVVHQTRAATLRISPTAASLSAASSTAVSRSPVYALWVRMQRCGNLLLHPLPAEPVAAPVTPSVHVDASVSDAHSSEETTASVVESGVGAGGAKKVKKGWRKRGKGRTKDKKEEREVEPSQTWEGSADGDTMYSDSDEYVGEQEDGISVSEAGGDPKEKKHRKKKRFKWPLKRKKKDKKKGPGQPDQLEPDDSLMDTVEPSSYASGEFSSDDDSSDAASQRLSHMADVFARWAGDAVEAKPDKKQKKPKERKKAKAKAAAAGDASGDAVHGKGDADDSESTAAAVSRAKRRRKKKEERLKAKRRERLLRKYASAKAALRSQLGIEDADAALAMTMEDSETSQIDPTEAVEDDTAQLMTEESSVDVLEEEEDRHDPVTIKCLIISERDEHGQMIQLTDNDLGMHVIDRMRDEGYNGIQMAFQNHLTPAGVHGFLAQSFDWLRCIRLNSCRLGEMARELGRLIRSPSCQLRELDLADTGMDDTGAVILCDALESGNRHLESLNLSHNTSISDRMGASLITALLTHPIATLGVERLDYGESASHSPTFILALRECGLERQSAHAVAAVRTALPGVVLVVGGNSVVFHMFDDAHRENRVLTGVPMPPTLPLKAYHTKRGGFVKSWKRRWFVLSSTDLRYWDNDGESRQLGKIEVDSIERVALFVADEGPQGPTDDLVSWVVAVSDREFIIRAETRDEARRWVDAITYLRLHKKR